MIRSAACARSMRSKATPRMSTRAAAKAPSLVDCDEASAEEVEVLERHTRALGHAVERVLGHVAGDSGDLRQKLVHVTQKSAAAGEDHALVDDVRRELWRRFLENGFHRAHDLLQDRIHRLGDLVRTDRDRPRQTRDEIPAAHFHGELRIHRQGRADLDLHILGGALSDHQVVALTDEVRDRFVELVTGGANAARDDDAPERDDRDLRGPAADVDDQIAGWTGDRNVRADRGGERLLDEVRLARARSQRGVLHRAAFDARHAGRNADHELGADELDASRHLVDEVLEHALGDDVVRDHSVAHWTERGDGAGGTAEHEPRLLADRDDPGPVRPILLRERDDGWLGEDDPLPTDVHDDVGGAEVDADLAGEHALNSNRLSDPKVRYFVTHRP